MRPPARRRSAGPILKAGLLAGLAGALLAGFSPAASAGAAGAKPPRVVPLPSPPPGPKIRRVTHDAVKPVLPGARVVVTVLTEPKMTVTAALGSVATGIPCSPNKGEPGAYACEAIVPEKGEGLLRVKAQVTDSKGRSSSLSAALPIVVEKPDPWREPNALNMRLLPVYFAAGSADLDAPARADLARDADSLKAHPLLPIAVEGHCDEGEEGDLDALSRRRAEAARDLLAASGLPKERMTVRAMAASQPVSARGDEAGRPLNRRVMILFEPAKPEAPSATKP